MNFLDYFFYWSYKLTDKVKEERDAKWSAFLFTSLYVGLFVLLIIYSCGLFFENPISKLFKDNSEVMWILVFILTPLLIGIRYYRFKNIKSMKVANENLSTFQKIFFKILLYLFLISCPVLTIITYRIYLNLL